MTMRTSLAISILVWHVTCVYVIENGGVTDNGSALYYGGP
jgi:hypothetical protein